MMQARRQLAGGICTGNSEAVGDRLDRGTDVKFTTTVSLPVALAIAVRPGRTSITLSEA